MEQSPNPEDWLGQPVEVLKLPVRVWHVLRNAGCHRIRDVVMLEENEILKHRNFGEKSFRVLTERLAELGLRLGMLPGPKVVEAMFQELNPRWVVVREKRPDKGWGVVCGASGKNKQFGLGDWVAYHPGRKVELAPGLFAVPCDDILGILRRDWLDRMEVSEKEGK